MHALNKYLLSKSARLPEDQKLPNEMMGNEKQAVVTGLSRCFLSYELRDEIFLEIMSETSLNPWGRLSNI